MAEKKGIKETKELVTGVCTLAPILVKVAKDGVQATDALEVYKEITSKPEVMEAIMTAYSNATEIPAELADIDLAETVELVIHGGKEAIKVISALKA